MKMGKIARQKTQHAWQVAATHLPRVTDNPADAEVPIRRKSLFQDSEPEITTQPSRRDLPLMAHKSNATML